MNQTPSKTKRKLSFAHWLLQTDKIVAVEHEYFPGISWYLVWDKFWRMALGRLENSSNHIIFGGLRIPEGDMPWLQYDSSRSNWTQHLQPPDARHMFVVAAANASNWEWLGRWDEFRWGSSVTLTGENGWLYQTNKRILRWIWGFRWLPFLVHGSQASQETRSLGVS